MPSKTRNFIALDTETTDLSPDNGRIIEVAALKYQDGKLVDRFEQLIDPGTKIPSVVVAITNITDKDVEGQPEFSQIKSKLADFIGDLPIVGHNIGFDMGFLDAEGLSLKNSRWDTFQLATMVLPTSGSYSLESLASLLKIKQKKAHRAADDAEATALLFQYLLGRVDKLNFDLLKSIKQIATKARWDLGEIFVAAYQQAAKTGMIPDKQKSKLATEENKVQKDPTDGKAIEFPTDMLDDSGLLSKKWPSFEFRPPQVKMMRVVAESLQDEKKAIIEAGSGTGKSLAYLLPAAYWAKNNKKPVVVSTYTRTLQDQLSDKDMPIVQKVTPFPVTWAVVKGKENYLCWNRFMALKKLKKLTAAEVAVVIKVLIWLEHTKTGEVGEIHLTHREYYLQDRLSANRQGCLGRECSYHRKKECFYQQARSRAKQSDIIIVNHSLMTTDAYDENRLLLPEAMIIDEAHHLEDAATSALGVAVSQYSILGELEILEKRGRGILPRLRKAGSISRDDIEDAREKVNKMNQNAVILFGIMGILAQRIDPGQATVVYESRLTKEAQTLDIWLKVGKAAAQLMADNKELNAILKKIEEQRDDIEESDFMNIRSARIKLGEMLYELDQAFNEPDFVDNVYWLKIFGQERVSFNRAPLAIGEFLKKNLWEQCRTAILTSATLRLGEKFSYFRQRLALDESFSEIVLPSQYDYKKQALTMIPTDISGPNDQNFSNEVSQVVMDTANELKGRTLVLFTSFSGIKHVFDKVQQPLRQEGIEVLAQKISGGRRKIIDKFKQSEKAVILGTASFWQGIDLIGDDLQAVIIVKLPFDVPSEPVFAARSEQYSNGFMDFSLPRAVLRFRQGFGRLVRSQKDRGVVILMDRRLQDQRYGEVFMQSLPDTTLDYLPSEEIAPRIGKWMAK